jgi:transcriptional antiterminator RfaH
MAFWSVAQTESSRERVADAFLKQRGFETYLPKIEVKRRVVPLFPAYIFVRIVDHWYAVANCVGVTQLLLAGDQPARLRDKVVDDIRGKERDGIVRLPRKRVLQIGDKVEIVAGYLKGHFALYDGMASHERERVLIELLGRQTRVEIPRLHMRQMPLPN